MIGQKKARKTNSAADKYIPCSTRWTRRIDNLCEMAFRRVAYEVTINMLKRNRYRVLGHLEGLRRGCRGMLGGNVKELVFL